MQKEGKEHDSLEKLMSSRAAHRGIATRYLNKITDILDNEDSLSDEDHDELERLKLLLTNKRNDIKTKNESIEEMIDEIHMVNEIEAAAANLEEIDSCLLRLKKATQTKLTPKPTEQKTTVSARLPKLTLPTFKGDYLEFMNYLELFEANVHNRKDIDDVQRFSYLRTTVEGEPEHLIANLELSSANYQAALKMLKDRYGDKNRIIQEHYRKVLALDPKNETLDDLKSFYDKLELHVRGLASQGKEAESYGDLLTLILMDKLSPSIRRTLARDHRDTAWTLENFRTALNREIKAMEQDKKVSKKPIQHSAASFVCDTKKLDKHDDSRNQATNYKRTPQCPFCDKDHKPVNCNVVTSVNERLTIAKRKGLCFNCLRKHIDETFAKDCTRGACQHCKGKHHSSLHDKKRDKEGAEKKQPENRGANVNLVNSHSGGALKTFMGYVEHKGKTVKVSILLDDGSSDSFCTEKLARRLNLPSLGEQTFNISTFGNDTREHCLLSSCPLTLKTLQDDIHMKVVVVPYICVPVITATPKLSEEDNKKLIGLTPAQPIKSGSPVDLLIASDFYYSLVLPQYVTLDCGMVAVNTKCGFVLCGQLPSPNLSLSSNYVGLSPTSSSQASPAVTPYEEWDAESSPSEDGNETLILQDFHASIQQDWQTGQYTVMLPWISTQDKSMIPTNQGVAFHRTQTMISKFSSNPTQFKKLSDIFQEYIDRGYIEKTNTLNLKTQKLFSYLPWHAVYKDSSINTKMRVVFDCSCVQRTSGLSLNDFLWKGPNLTNNLVKILLRFRLYKIAFVADIEKAFLAIKIRHEDRPFLRFFFLEDITDSESRLVSYNFTVNLFGSRASTFILAAVLQYHLESINSAVATDMLENILVDNVVAGCETKEEAVAYYKEARSVLKQAAMNLRQWTSNESAVNKLAQMEQVQGPSTPHVLGIKWNSTTDELSLNPFTTSKRNLWTKRQIFSDIARVFDPFGWLSPLTIAAKLLVQELWKRKVPWDEAAPDDLVDQWKFIAMELERYSSTCARPRRILSDMDELAIDIFVDSSLLAYAACAYINNELYFAKAKVGPVKQRTIPEMELMAMHLGATIGLFLQQTLPSALPRTIRYWSDSKVCIAWLQTSKPLKPFVRNRVERIKGLQADFKYIPSHMNPADCATRGVPKAIDSTIWWTAPSNIPEVEEPEPSPQVQELVCLTTKVKEKIGQDPLILVCRFSSLLKVQRVVAQVIRMAKKMKGRAITEEPTTDEMAQSLTILLKQSQQQEYGNVLVSMSTNKPHPLIRQHGLYQDKTGILRCKGRLENCHDLDEAQRAPVLLGKDTLARLIVLQCHVRSLHSGTRTTLMLLRTQFWIPAGRSFVRSILRRCVTCKKTEGRAYAYPDPPGLPEYRVNQAPPFSAVGIDYTGHLFVKTTSDSQEPSKVYIALFACCVTRAIHLELALDLSKEQFILVFRRFCARRSTPTTVVTDNATYFEAGRDEVKEILADPDVKAYFCNHSIKWINIPGRSPAWGGQYERLIGVMKATLKKVLCRSLLTLSEMQTLLTEVEAAVNNRPISYMEDENNPGAILPITPSHFLHGRILLTFPYPSIDNSDPDYGEAPTHKHYQQRLAYRAHKMQQLWSRWKQEYLSTLRERQLKLKRQCSMDSPSIGDVVLVHDDNSRSNWRLGLIKALFIGDDGKERVASVRINGVDCTRAIYKLYPLETEHCENDTVSDNGKDGVIEHPGEDAEVTPPSDDAEVTPLNPYPTMHSNASTETDHIRPRRLAFRKAQEWLKAVTDDLRAGNIS